MLSVRIRDQNYRVSNETLDRALGESWRSATAAELRRRVQASYDEGKLLAKGQRLRSATMAEEAEQRLRWAETQAEILRWGLLNLAYHIAEVAAEVRSLRKAVSSDESAASARLSRDTSPDPSELESTLRRSRPEASDEFVETVAERVTSALHESDVPSPASSSLLGG
jgi:hypothetical protein